MFVLFGVLFWLAGFAKGGGGGIDGLKEGERSGCLGEGGKGNQGGGIGVGRWVGERECGFRKAYFRG